MAAEDYRQPQGFPATQWSLVARAGQTDAEAKRDALGQLLGRYLPALQAHLIYHKGLAPQAAEDLVQQFVADKILEKDLIARADRRLGKLRTYLLTALDRFLSNQLRNASAKKRSPGEDALVAFDERQDGLYPGRRPSEAFDVVWAKGVISEALRRMRKECEMSKRMDLWGVFHCRVIGPTLEGAPAVDYAELVERFGLKSPMQASNVLTTAKRMYARALRAAVGEYAADRQEVESEINELRGILAGAAD